MYNIVKVKCTLRVTLNHPYIDAESVNNFHKMRRHPRVPFEMVWTMEMKL